TDWNRSVTKFIRETGGRSYPQSLGLKIHEHYGAAIDAKQTSDIAYHRFKEFSRISYVASLWQQFHETAYALLPVREMMLLKGKRRQTGKILHQLDCRFRQLIDVQI